MNVGGSETRRKDGGEGEIFDREERSRAPGTAILLVTVTDSLHYREANGSYSPGSSHIR